MSTIRAYLGVAGLLDVGYRFYLQNTAESARVSTGIVDEGEGWYSATGVILLGDHVRWDSTGTPAAAARENVYPGVATVPAANYSGSISTVTFKALLDDCADRCGVLNGDGTIGSATAAFLIRMLQKRMRQAWRYYPWPDLTTIEQRQYRDSWASGTTYAEDDEVYGATQQAYYRSLQAGNIAHAVTDTAWWTPATELDRYITFTQTDQHQIGEPVEAYSQNPRVNRAALVVSFLRSSNGLQFDDRAPVRPWIAFRKPVPQFSGTAWSAGAYTAGRVIFYATDGECYKALLNTSAIPGTDNTIWELQPVPEIFHDFIVEAVWADQLDDDGQTDKTIAQNSVADDLLAEERNQLTKQQGQTQRYKVRVR